MVKLTGLTELTNKCPEGLYIFKTMFINNTLRSTVTFFIAKAVAHSGGPGVDGKYASNYTVM